jgi:hypothetical protein
MWVCEKKLKISKSHNKVLLLVFGNLCKTLVTQNFGLSPKIIELSLFCFLVSKHKSVKAIYQ